MGKVHELRDYLDKIKEIYLKANEDYAKLVDIVAAMDRREVEISSDITLTPAGKDAEREKVRATRDKSTKQMASIANDAKAKAQAVREEVKEDFYSLYHATGERLDMPTLELLKADVLTDREIMDLGGKFQDNPTMLRILGKYARERKDEQLRLLAQVWQSAADQPHLQAVDSMIGICNYLVGDAPLSGPEGVRAFAARIDELIAPVYAKAPAVGWKFAEGSLEHEFIRG